MSERDDHAGDALSALLDGELDAAEAELVRRHVDVCLDCQRELDDVREARRLVRALPALDPRRRLGLPRPPAWRTVANAAASVAAGIALLVVSASGIGRAAVEPEVDGALARHASTISALQAGGIMDAGADRLQPERAAPPTTAPRRSLDDLPGSFGVAPRLGGYELVDAYRAPTGLHLLYRDGPFGLSVFEERGSIDWDSLPRREGSMLTVGGRRAWRWESAPCNGRVVVLELDGMVVTLVGDEPGDAVLDAAAAMPSVGSPSTRDRMGRAVARALELLSPMP